MKPKQKRNRAFFFLAILFILCMYFVVRGIAGNFKAGEGMNFNLSSIALMCSGFLGLKFLKWFAGEVIPYFTYEVFYSKITKARWFLKREETKGRYY